MDKEGLTNLLKEKQELRDRTARVYDQIVGQIVLIEDLIKNSEETKEEPKE
jgi:hypothetical protein